MNSTVDDEVVVFVSGHGVLDSDFDFYFATHNMNFTNPSEFGLSYDALDDLLNGIPARKKLLLIDACHSGEVDKSDLISKNIVVSGSAANSNSKGASAAQKNRLGLSNSFELMQELFTNLNRGNGSLIISAAAGDSEAYENNRLQNGVFTYCVRNGLGDNKNGEKLADTNFDNAVTVTELREYVNTEVQILTNGLQKPTTRSENIEYDYVIK